MYLSSKALQGEIALENIPGILTAKNAMAQELNLLMEKQNANDALASVIIEMCLEIYVPNVMEQELNLNIVNRVKDRERFRKN